MILLLKIYLFCVGFALVFSANVGVSDNCSHFCDASYKSQDTQKSCKEGCKNYFLEKEPDRPKKCSESCAKVYIDRDLSDACSAGCFNQTSQDMVILSMDGSSPFFSKMSDYVNGMFGRMKNMFNFDDNFGNMMRGDMWSGDSTVSRMMQRIRNMLGLSSSNFAPLHPIIREDLQSNEDSDGSSQDKSDNELAPVTVGNVYDQNGSPALLVRLAPATLDAVSPQLIDLDSAEDSSTVIKEPPPHEPLPPVAFYEEDWVACLGRRIRHLSLITRWMLCIALLLSVISMVWICLAILRSSSRRRLPYLNPMAGKKGMQNVYYATPPFTVSDKSPMMVATHDYKPPMVDVELPPPTYDSLAEKKEKE